MKLSRFVIVKLTCVLILGICIGFYVKLPVHLSLIGCLGLLFMLFIAYYKDRKSFFKRTAFGILALLLTTCIGIFNVQIHDDRLQNDHYTHFNSEVQTISFKIRDQLKPNLYYNKYIVQLLKINDEAASGLLLLNVSKDSIKNNLNIDDVYLSRSSLSEINSALNPGQFNYKTYLERQNVYKQLTLTNNKLLKIPHPQPTIYGFADRVKRRLQNQLKVYQFGPQESAILNALLLGERRDISDSLYKNYTNAGAVHILAVSGLHIGILLLILNFIFKPIEKIKYGKGYKTIIILVLLWTFAIITGLSASVTRATTMFSLVAIALNWNRKSNIYNTIAISVFILLLFKPLFLFDVGFQLSYLAVLGIVTFQPALYGLWRPKSKIINLLWNTLTVTFAAQVGVLPLSLFYFHQFPGLFFLSNLIIVPMLGIILGLGILVLSLASIHLLPQILADSYNGLIALMNAFIHWVAHQERFIIDGITLQLNTMLATYLVIFSLIYYYTKRHAKSVAVVLVCVILVQSTLIYNVAGLQTKEGIVFHKNRKTILGFRNHLYLDIKSDVYAEHLTSENIIRDYVLSKPVDSIHFSNLSPIYSIGDKQLLIIDSLGVYNIKHFSPDYILLRNSPKLNLRRVIALLQPKQIIADGSNYTSYVKRWEATCNTKKLPFHHTGKKGAYILKE